MVPTISSKMGFNRSQCRRAAGKANIKGRETPGDHVVAAATGPPDELVCTLDCDENSVLWYTFSRCLRSFDNHLTEGQGPDGPTLHEIVASHPMCAISHMEMPTGQGLACYHQVRRN